MQPPMTWDQNILTNKLRISIVVIAATMEKLSCIIARFKIYRQFLLQQSYGFWPNQAFSTGTKPNIWRMFAS